MPVPAALDHLVLATPDLATAVDAFARESGVEPARGGRHVGRGTANFLVGLSPTSYLEIVGPDPDQPEPDRPRPFGIDTLDRTRLLTWAVHPAGPDHVVARARADGDDPGDLTPMSRRTPAGELLAWRLTPDRGVLPFLIDWGDTPHPARGLPTVGLASLVVRSSHPGTTRRRLAALGAGDVEVEPAAADALLAVLTTARGQLVLPG